MSQSRIGYIDQNARSNWMRLRTLVTVRWVAITGQILALGVGHELYGLSLALGPCSAVIGLSILANIFAVLIFPDNRRLSESETVLTLLFDTLQLSLLLAFTGGLNNPFALLILAPVTIAATVLPTRSTLLLAFCAVVMTTTVALVHLPLRTANGGLLEMPLVFVFGFWVAIVTGIIFISIYTRRVTTEMTSMSEALLATQMALAREQKLTDLGGVVAATAHELGTPLATIKLVSAELMEELKDTEPLHADAQLIREQAERCGAILRSMGRAGKEDLHLRTTLWSALVREAAEPHLDRGKTVTFAFEDNLEADPDQPQTFQLVARPGTGHDGPAKGISLCAIEKFQICAGSFEEGFCDKQSKPHAVVSGAGTMRRSSIAAADKGIANAIDDLWRISATVVRNFHGQTVLAPTDVHPHLGLGKIHCVLN
jgi:two-component system sensor histidine kinase RegB